MKFNGVIQKVLPKRSGVSERTGNEWASQGFIFEYKENATDRLPDRVILETFDTNVMAEFEKLMVLGADGKPLVENAIRHGLNPKPEGMTKEESFAYYQGCRPEDMFEVKQTTLAVPEKARLFTSFVCDCCGEVTGANWVRLSGDQKLCLDCYRTYNRFDV